MSDGLIEFKTWHEEKRRIERDPLFKEFQQNPEPYDVLIAHGSNSGSLIGFAEEKGLVPAGWMLLEDKSTVVPFSGELSKGLRGINQQAISFSSPSGQHKALEYATTKNETRNNVEGWTPELSRSRIELSQADLEDPHHVKNEHLRNIAIKTIKIEERRIAVFNNLTPQEQTFVSTPFPVVYGVHYDHSTNIAPRIKKMYDGTESELPGEVYIEGKIDASLFSLFVPRARIEEVEEYLKAKEGLRITILPLEIYSFLVNRDWTNWDPSGDIYKQASTFSKRFPTLHDYVVATKKWVNKSPVPV